MLSTWILAFVVTGTSEPLSSHLDALEESGRAHLYNLEFEQAKALFEKLTETAPELPAGPYYEATTLWMEEFSRRGGMNGSTFRTGRYWSEKHREPLAPALGRDFKSLVAESIRRADLRIAQDPNDIDALYFRGAAEGVLSAFHASLEHSYFRSYRAGRRAKKFHERVLELSPDYADACLLPGIFEYTVATLPKTLKLAGLLVGLRGSREKGMALVERAVERGQRTRWVSRLSLSVLHQREKKYQNALATLAELEREFPRNPLFPLERGGVFLLRKDFPSARRTFEEVRAKREAGAPNYGAVPSSLIRLKIGESLLFGKNFARASEELNEALSHPGVPAPIKAQIFLRRGMASDGLGNRRAAEWDYRRALRLDADKITNRLAKRYLDEPFR